MGPECGMTIGLGQTVALASFRYDVATGQEQ